MSELIDALDREHIDLKTFNALLGFRNQQHNLHGLRPTCDDEQVVELIGRMCGSYLRFPPPRSVAVMIDDFVLIRRLNALEEASKNDDFKALHLASRAFEKAANKVQIPGHTIEWTAEQVYEAAITHALNLRREIREAVEWQAHHEEAQLTDKALRTKQQLADALTPEDEDKIDGSVRTTLVREYRLDTGRCTDCGGKLSRRCRACLDAHAERQRKQKAQKTKSK